jgi:hypothetical protein
MRGDGHTAYGGNSPCIDNSVNAYIETLALPAKGTICQQDVPFGAAPLARAAGIFAPNLAGSPASFLWRAAPHVITH